jgi:hypothetical protein
MDFRVAGVVQCEQIAAAGLLWASVVCAHASLVDVRLHV